jgi:hypothetical protein
LAGCARRMRRGRMSGTTAPGWPAAGDAGGGGRLDGR